MVKPVVGQIFTFYSYKGGTGRSMALANVGCLLAQKWAEKKKVLMIDWDLEAPGLHRFFEKKISFPKSNSFAKQPGLIDLFSCIQELSDKKNFNSEITDKFFDDLHLEKYILKTRVANLFLMTAGRFDTSYSTRVNTFNWEELFLKSPGLISSFANYLAEKFRYVLIDSRTGFTDISSVCTALMPEKLVVVYTPNRQSLSGAIDLVENVTLYRKKSDDLRPLIIFPLPSRIENAERELQKDWRFGSKQNKIDGYQPQFEAVFRKVYDLSSLSLKEYFDDIQIQYVPRYSYGEEISVLSDRTEDRLSLARSYENFAKSLVLLDAPWEYKTELSINLGEIKNSNIYISGSYTKRTVAGDSFDVDIVAATNQSTRKKGKLRVFLSHASIDKPTVRELYERLSKIQWIDPWLDEENLLPGQDWDLEIEKALEDSHAVIVCLSSNSATKEGYVQKELRLTLDIALEKSEGRIFILPVRLDECEVPHRIRSWQYVDYFPKDRKDKAFKKLVEALRIRKDSITIHE